VTRTFLRSPCAQAKNRDSIRSRVVNPLSRAGLRADNSCSKHWCNPGSKRKNPSAETPLRFS
jgi:hypothetical protein